MSTEEPKRYEIRTIHDLLPLTPEQRQDCVTDILYWCDFNDALAADPAMKPLIDAGVAFSMTWIDDKRPGVHGVSINGEIVPLATEASS